MEREKVLDIVNNVNDKPNKVLNECKVFLETEYEKVKNLIIDLTKHMDGIEEIYRTVSSELRKRGKL